MTNRSTSNSAIKAPVASPDRRRSRGSYLLAALAHLGAEFAIDHFGKTLGPLIHEGHALLDRHRFGRQKLLAERRSVERHQVLQLLLGECLGVDSGHAIADFLLATGELLRDDDLNFVEILLVVEIGLQQLVLGLMDEVRN